MLLALGSAKGSPGVTTTALALAAAASHALGRTGALLLEADPSGGDLECWCGPLGEPGLLGAVTDIQDRSSSARLDTSTVEVVTGVDAITAPTTDLAAGAALRSASQGFFEAVGACERTVIADIGRVASAGARNEGLLWSADLVVLVCRPTLASVEHCRTLVEATPSHVPAAAVVVGGVRPYGPDEIARALGVRVAAVLPWDQRGVAALVERGVGRSWLRSSLGVAATELFDSLTASAARRSELTHG